MLKELVKLANHLDKIGQTKFAGELDSIIKKLAQASNTPDPDKYSKDGKYKWKYFNLNSNKWLSPEWTISDKAGVISAINDRGDSGVAISLDFENPDSAASEGASSFVEFKPYYLLEGPTVSPAARASFLFKGKYLIYDGDLENRKVGPDCLSAPSVCGLTNEREATEEEVIEAIQKVPYGSGIYIAYREQMAGKPVTVDGSTFIHSIYVPKFTQYTRGKEAQGYTEGSLKDSEGKYSPVKVYADGSTQEAPYTAVALNDLAQWVRDNIDIGAGDSLAFAYIDQSTKKITEQEVAYWNQIPEVKAILVGSGLEEYYFPMETDPTGPIHTMQKLLGFSKSMIDGKFGTQSIKRFKALTGKTAPKGDPDKALQMVRAAIASRGSSSSSGASKSSKTTTQTGTETSDMATPAPEQTAVIPQAPSGVASFQGVLKELEALNKPFLPKNYFIRTYPNVPYIENVNNPNVPITKVDALKRVKKALGIREGYDAEERINKLAQSMEAALFSNDNALFRRR